MGAERVPGRRIAAPPTIDGVIHEDEWKGAASVTGLYDDSNGAPCPESGTFWIGYDDRFIYFAARLGDSHPKEVRATEYRTNVSLTGDDTVSVQIDLSGSTSDFNFFTLNANGATNIELAGGRAAKREWSGEFTSKGRVTETGWEAEARIPWQILRLPGAGKRDLRVNFSRFMPRTMREFVYSYTNNVSANTPVWADVEIPAQEMVRTLKLLPYAYAGYDRETKHIFNAGLDLKTQLTDQIEFVGTINPDFRNIENQILSLDFSRFERLAGESRPFFQEGSGYLGSALFASQRIDNFDAGVNTYGKLSNKTSFGLLDTIDWNRRDDFFQSNKRGTQNNLVATVTHDPDPSLSLRLAVTSLNSPTLNNDAYLLRAAKTWGNYSLQLRDFASRDSEEGYGRFQDAILNYNSGGWNVYGLYAQSTPDFLPRLAFFPERDYKGFEYGTNYNKNFDKGYINDYGFFVGGSSFKHFDGSPYRHGISLNPYTTIRNGPAIAAFVQFEDFEGSKDELYDINVAYPRGNPYRRIALDYTWGHQAGFPYKSFSVNGAYRTFGRLQTGLRYQQVKLGSNSHDQAIFTASYDLGRDRSISGRLVRADDSTNFYVALRQSGNLGTEYFLILGDPNARSFRSSLILKVTVPFEIPLSKRQSGKRTEISRRDSL